MTLAGEGIALQGWLFRAAPPSRGLVVYLHGSSDNRGSVVATVRHLVPRGFDVLAYDGRAHGESEGAACTYGVKEKRDLARVLDALERKGGRRPVALIGVSLGAAVALQAAADDARIGAVVSISTFSDLATVARERAPFFASQGNIRDAFALAEKEGDFRVADASPVAAAPHIHVPVLVIHGAADVETRPEHSRRVFDALPAATPKRLVLRPGAGHSAGLDEASWAEVIAWIESALLQAHHPAEPTRVP